MLEFKAFSFGHFSLKKIMSQQSKSYQENYQKLKNIAQAMRDVDEPDIDQLVALVGEATKAYNFCQARIEAVEKALGVVDEK
jgi:exodeoxyribonuclease VII small subunit